MKIELSSHSGFCMGVRNALLRIIKELNASDTPIYVDGPIIHNPQTIVILEKRGLLRIPDDESAHDKIIAIRTHGISKDKLLHTKKIAKRIINLTCPRVAKVQSIIQKYSKDKAFTIIVGDEDHAEVIGLKSYAHSGVVVISNVNDIVKIPPAAKYLVVSQTTFDRRIFEEILQALKEKFNNRLYIFDTICNSTNERQRDVVLAIEHGINVLIVVGGKNSANTRRLAELGKVHGIRTYHIETADELTIEEFRKNDHVFLTAGASTPGWIINNVLEKLYDIQYRHYGKIATVLKKAAEFLVRTNIISSISAFFITAFTSSYVGIPSHFSIPLASSCYLFSMYSINNIINASRIIESNPYKYLLYSVNKKIFIALSITGILVSFIMIIPWGIYPFAFYLFSTILGVVYSTNSFQKLINKTHIDILKKVYNLKTLVTSFGWIIVCVVVPFSVYQANNWSYVAALFFIFGFIFCRNIILDIIGLQGDLIFGRETLPIVLGLKRTVLITIFITLLCFITFCALSMAFGKFSMLSLSATYPYYLILLLNISRKEYIAALKYEFLTEANFLIFISLYSISSSL